VPTTCYDYAQYTSSKCGAACQNNDFNLVCSMAASGKCQTYTFPGRGVVGYGCDTDIESTSTTIYSTFVSGSALAATGSALARTTVTAYMSIFPAYAITGTTGFASGTSRSTYSYGATTTYRSGSSSGSYNNYDTGTSTAVGLVIVIVILVIFGLGYLCAIALLIYLCRRHKKYITAIDQQNAARAAGFTGAISVAPYNNSNVIPPGSHQSQYFGQQDPNAGFYNTNKGDPSPQMGQAYPAPVGTPPPMVSGSPAPTYTSNGMGYGSPAPNTNSVYGYPPGQVYSPQQPQGQEFAPQQVPGQAYSPPQQVPGQAYSTPQQPQAQAYQPSPVAAPVPEPAPQTKVLHELQ
jgi:hypothetical protein